MRAMVLQAPGSVSMEDVPEPTDSDATILRVEAVGICGSELHAYRHPGLRRLPLVMGHEFTGINVTSGERVVVNPLMTCGSCASCARRQPELCASRRIVGIDVPGAFADLVAVPAETCLPIEGEVSPEAGSLVEPLANGVHAWRRANLEGAARVAVVGGGPIGLTAAFYAAAGLGLRPVVFEPRSERRDVAIRMGAAAAYSSIDESEDLEFDVVVDAVGSGETRAASLEAVRPGGTVVCIGLASPEAGVEGQLLVRQEKTLTGSYCYNPDDFGVALSLAPRLDVGWVDSIGLEDAAQVFTELATGRSGIIKAVVRP